MEIKVENPYNFRPCQVFSNNFHPARSFLSTALAQKGENRHRHIKTIFESITFVNCFQCQKQLQKGNSQSSATDHISPNRNKLGIYRPYAKMLS